MLAAEPVRRLLFFAALEGALALLLVFRVPSEPGSAWLWGFSKARLATAGLLAGGVLLIGVLSWAARSRPVRFETLLTRLNAGLRKDHRLPAALLLCGLLTAGILLLLLLNIAPIAPHLGSLTAVVERLLYPLLWLGLLGVQGLVVLVRSFPERIRAPGFWDPGALARTLLLAGILAAALFHWLVLLFRIQVFARLPGWYWVFRTHEDEFGTQWLFVPLAAGVLVIGFWVWAKTRSVKITLPVLMALGVALQLGMGFVEAGSVEPVRLKYADSEHSTYAGLAGDQPRLADVIGDYEARYAGLHHVDTKPPGVLVFYVLTQRASNLVRPETRFEGRFERLTRFATFVYPVLSMLTLLPLYSLSRRFLGAQTALVPGLLYIVSPNVVLIPLFLDQVLYPLLACTILLWTVLAVERCSMGWAAAAGALFYLGLFFSFSLLPVGLLAGGLGWLLAWEARLHLRRAAALGGAAAGGFLALLLLFKLGGGYDMLVRYRASIAVHQANRGFAAGLAGFIDGLELSNLDFAVWAGFPIVLLALSGVLGTLRRMRRGAAGPRDGFTLAFAGTYMALNLFGQTTSEVGRLWIYLVPFTAIIAAGEMGGFARIGLSEKRAVLLVVFLQLVTVFLVFRFQDFAA